MNTGLTICFNRVLRINQPPQLNLKALPPTLPLTFFLLLYNQFCHCLKTFKSIQIPLECICSITTSLIVSKCLGLSPAPPGQKVKKVKKISDSFEAAMAASPKSSPNNLRDKTEIVFGFKPTLSPISITFPNDYQT